MLPDDGHDTSYSYKNSFVDPSFSSRLGKMKAAVYLYNGEYLLGPTGKIANGTGRYPPSKKFDSKSVRLKLVGERSPGNDDPTAPLNSANAKDHPHSEILCAKA